MQQSLQRIASIRFVKATALILYLSVAEIAEPDRRRAACLDSPEADDAGRPVHAGGEASQEADRGCGA